MRKLSVAIVAAVMLVCVPAMAQTYPDWMKGDILRERAFEVNAFMTEALYLPYSIPDSSDNLSWLGEVSGHAGYIEWTVLCLHRFPAGECLTGPLPGYDGKILYWNPAAQCYLNMEILPDGTATFESFTVQPMSVSGKATWATGCFDVVPGHPIPYFEVTDQCPFMLYDVYPVSQLRAIPVRPGLE